MYITDVLWWAYVAFTLGTILFMLYFVRKVTEKGG